MYMAMLKRITAPETDNNMINIDNAVLPPADNVVGCAVVVGFKVVGDNVVGCEAADGITVGLAVGFAVGLAVGLADGITVGLADGFTVGFTVGDSEKKHTTLPSFPRVSVPSGQSSHAPSVPKFSANVFTVHNTQVELSLKLPGSQTSSVGDKLGEFVGDDVVGKAVGESVGEAVGMIKQYMFSVVFNVL
jgi:hypothetical protein